MFGIAHLNCEDVVRQERSDYGFASKVVEVEVGIRDFQEDEAQVWDPCTEWNPSLPSPSKSIPEQNGLVKICLAFNAQLPVFVEEPPANAKKK